MKKLLCFLILAGMSALSAGTFSLAQGGKTTCEIVLPENPAPVLKTAARELAGHLKQITGAEFPVVSETKHRADAPGLFIGPVKQAAGVFPDPGFANAKPDTTAITFKGKDVFLNGKPQSGPLYAVYTFLEDYCGVRWWSHRETDVPHNPDLSVEAKDYLYAPKILSREAFYRNSRPCEQAARTKSNGHWSFLKPEYGDHRYIIGKVHTFGRFLPPAKYFKDHPEWYSLINGKRSGRIYETQLCLTNEEMTKEFIRVCLEQIAQNPTAWAISVTQNDTARWSICECDNCKALRQKLGSATDAELWFVNKVAAAIEEKYPDMLVETIAYHYTLPPPKTVRPRKNVMIRFAPLEADHSQPMETGSRNEPFRKNLEGWQAMAPRLFIWNYVCSFNNYILPHPNFRTLAPDIRYYAKIGAIGIFEQGDSGCNIGDFVRPRAWILAKLLWNPDLDEKAVAKEFFDGYYGAAGPYLLEYLNFLADVLAARNVKLASADKTTDHWLSCEDCFRARQLYAKAEEAVKDQPKFASRVRRERLGLDLAFLNNVAVYVHQCKVQGKKFPFDTQEVLKVADEFITLSEQWDAAQIEEGGPFGNYARDLREKVKIALETEKWPVPPEIRALPATRWDYLPPSFAVHVHINHWSFFIHDPLAPCGQALRIPNTHPNWTFQGNLPAFYAQAHKKWRFRVELRCDAKVTTGNALSFGIYDEVKKKNIYARTVKVEELKSDRYVTLETSPLALGQKQMFWCAAVVRNPAEVANVYISSITMIAAD